MTESELKLVRELRGTKCRCGRVKMRGRSFCKGCYVILPKNLQKALYHRISNGYEQAYDEALAFLVVAEMYRKARRVRTANGTVAQPRPGLVYPGMPSR